MRRMIFADKTIKIRPFLLFIGSGATAVSQFDRVFDDDLAILIQRVQAVSYHYDGRLELSVVGGYTDNKSISHSLTTSTLRKWNN